MPYTGHNAAGGDGQVPLADIKPLFMGNQAQETDYIVVIVKGFS